MKRPRNGVSGTVTGIIAVEKACWRERLRQRRTLRAARSLTLTLRVLWTPQWSTGLLPVRGMPALILPLSCGTAGTSRWVTALSLRSWAARSRRLRRLPRRARFPVTLVAHGSASCTAGRRRVGTASPRPSWSALASWLARRGAQVCLLPLHTTVWASIVPAASRSAGQRRPFGARRLWSASGRFRLRSFAPLPPNLYRQCR